MQINLLGYYGMRNIGDDLMLNNLLKYFLSKPQISRINVFCREAYYQPLERVKYFPLNKISRLQKMIQLMKNNFTFWGGGTCIYQSTASKGLFELRNMQQLVKSSRNKFIFLGIGIGKLESNKYLKAARDLLKDSDYCYFRDEDSLNRANNIWSQGKYCLGGDLAFLTDIILDKKTCTKIEKISFSGHYNFHKVEPKRFAWQLINLINHFNCKLYFLPAHTGTVYNDNDFHRKIAGYLPEKNYEICEWNNPLEYQNKLSNMDFHIGIRLHSLILADLYSIPNLGINYSPKILSYLNKTGIIPELRTLDILNDDIITKVQQVFEQYTYPKDFVQREKSDALACLDEVTSYV